MAFCLVLWTAKEMKEAKKISTELLERKKAACITLFPEVYSLFFWEGKLEEVREVKVLFKTTKEKVQDIVLYIQENSSYRVPEVLQVPIEGGNSSYLKWVEESLS